ncbi:unnamed protein product [Heligmosomoides polygyrus]|uniref:Uncharacterized protein n=1 Tax=Heligmosomoides polygyrus TaxID=6339 RepID=A0A3P8DR22_HELPZ|nr:unnamed protein product [Heligmosomoides polygyrus]
MDWLMRYGERGIAIDDTFDLTRYNLKVAALMVADGRDRGLPAGFLISSHMSSADITCLFEVIKELVPNFDPKVLMTDEGFKEVFPDAQTTLNFCRYHIYKTWTRKTSKV